MKNKCYIFDIDGTLADCEHRLHHIENHPKDWRSFFASVMDDRPIEHIVALASLIPHQLVVFVSGRSDECRKLTSDWLAQHLGAWASTRPLYMRKEGDHRADDIVKIELLGALRADGYDPIMAFDDRKRVVDAWRSAGVACAQVAPGDF